MTEVTPLTGSPARAARRARLPRSPFALVRLLALGTLLTGSAASAQLEGLPQIELERITLNPAGTGSLLLGTGELLQRRGYRFSFTGHYQSDPLVVHENGERVGALVGSRLTGHLTAAYGLFNRVEVAAQLPLLLTQSGDDLTGRGLPKPASGPALGTPHLSVRLGLLSQRDENAVDLALGAQVGLPVGSASALARDSSARILPSVMVGKGFGFLRAAADVGVMLRSSTVLSPDENIQDEVGTMLRLGAAVATTGEGLRGELNLIAAVPFNREGSALEVLAGARLPLNASLEAYALAGIGLGEAPGTPIFRGLLGVAYGGVPPKCVAGGDHAPEECPELDDDNDGVQNRDDTCVAQGGRVDEKGCPVKDSDGDGIVDPDDRCPEVPGLSEFQGCPDTDKDGIQDSEDKCPAVAGVREFQGCPDADKDGIQDSEDKCPAVAGVREFQGCPDTDKDGIQDSEDKCPTEPGIRELQGCPSKDTDGDTLPDHRDNCPTEAGPVDNQGCPVQQKQLVEIQQDRIEIKDKVFFDSGKSTIQRRSFKLLDQVAKVIIEHPELEKVWIEGHTDETGTLDFNRDLSQRRADAVRTYLIRKGVAPARLEARGLGKDRPVASNTTEQGRAANRRVEFLTTPREGEEQR
ncbi:OmpA family protein [Hyalangium rubrum]|uniref:OmpA family protein n=1 Tax=Hyalangium rubrum TaxID=3103134 RepID=A0ABU5H678_9BACT|nr:OmpA family protein [Hyalangium sp. s54d21]MDY7228840.1 OmpA family protein [Hyalangium sp. s54d21]